MINRKVYSAEFNSDLLDIFKKGYYTAAAVVWSPPREKTEECKDHRLYRATPPGRDKYHFLFILFPTICFTSVLVFITISYYV